MKLFILLTFCLGFVVCRDRLLIIYPPNPPLESESAQRPAIYRSAQEVPKEFLIEESEEKPIARKGDKCLDNESQSPLKSLKLFYFSAFRSGPIRPQHITPWKVYSFIVDCRGSIPSCLVDHFFCKYANFSSCLGSA